MTPERASEFEPVTLTPHQAAALAHVHVNQIREWCDSGEIKASKWHSKWYIDKPAFLAKMGLDPATRIIRPTPPAPPAPVLASH